MAKSFYDILGVPKDATDAQIRTAYRNLAKKHHPDVNQGNEAAAEKFKEISEAYDTLSDPDKRAAYDNPMSGAFGGGGGGGGNPFSGFGGFGGFGSVFDDLFSFGETAQQGAADITLNVTLTFEEAAFGVQKTITVNRLEPCADCKGIGAKDGTQYSTCNACGGNGKVRYAQDTPFGRIVNMRNCSACNGSGKIIKEKCSTCGGRAVTRKNINLTITFPPVEHGQIVTVPGEGERSKYGAKSGNLILVINVMPHKHYKRKGLDLYIEVPVTFMQAILGDKIFIPSLKGGQISFNLPESTQSGTTIKLKNYGVEHPKRNVKGDIYVTIKAEIPKSLSREQKKMLNDLTEKFKADQFVSVKEFNNNHGGK